MLFGWCFHELPFCLVPASRLVHFLRMQRAEQEPSIRKAKDINTQLTNDLRQLKKGNGQLNEEIEASKKERSDLQEQLVRTSSMPTV